jgi:hypothetical protein
MIHVDNDSLHIIQKKEVEPNEFDHTVNNKRKEKAIT